MDPKIRADGDRLVARLRPPSSSSSEQQARAIHFDRLIDFNHSMVCHCDVSFRTFPSNDIVPQTIICFKFACFSSSHRREAIQSFGVCVCVCVMHWQCNMCMCRGAEKGKGPHRSYHVIIDQSIHEWGRVKDSSHCGEAWHLLLLLKVTVDAKNHIEYDRNRL